MTLFTIVAKNLRRRLLGTSLTFLSLSAGITLFLTVDAVRKSSEDSFRNTAGAYDIVLAAKGSALQTVLNSLFHLENSTGIIPFAVYEAALRDPRVENAFPLYVGDQYNGFRIIGTSADFLLHGTPSKGSSFSWKSGKNFETPLECVLGFEAAQRLHLNIGDEIHPEHGISESGGESLIHEEAHLTVTGILAQTFTPADRVIFTDVRSMEFAHKPSGSDISVDSVHVDELDAVLVKFKNPAAAMQVAGVINYPTPPNPMLAMAQKRDPYFAFKTSIMAVIPAMEISKLMQIVGRADEVLRIVSLLVILISLLGLMVSMYNTMNERREELAIMRALGASRLVITSTILLEASVLAAFSALSGIVFLQVALWFIKPILASQAGVPITVPFVNPEALVYLLFFVLSGVLAGLIPAFSAYRVDPVTTLSKEL